METPGKIYILPSCHNRWYEEIRDGDNIEYTRTDAFIEKACEWLSKHAIKYYLDGSKFLGTDELVEDFKIAMTL